MTRLRKRRGHREGVRGALVHPSRGLGPPDDSGGTPPLTAGNRLAWPRASCLLLALAAAVGCSNSPDTAKREDQLSALQARLERIEQARLASRQSLQDLAGELAALRKDHERALQQFAALRKEMHAGAGRPGDPVQIVPYLHHSDLEVRLAAMTMVSRLRVRQAVPLLLEIAERDPESKMRTSAIAALEKLRPKEFDTLLRTLLTDHDSKVSMRAVSAIAALAHPKFVKPLGEALRRSLAERSRRRGGSPLGKVIVQALYRIGDPAGVPYMLEVLASNDAYLIQDVARYLPRLVGPAVAPQVIELARSRLAGKPSREADAVVIALLNLLTNLGAPEAVPFMIELLNGPAKLRQYAQGSLTRLAARGGFEPLAAAFAKAATPDGEPLDDEARAALAEALGATRDRRAVAVLLDALDGASPLLAGRIVRALGRVHDRGQSRKMLAAWQNAAGNSALRAGLQKILRSGRYAVRWEEQSRTFSLDEKALQPAGAAPGAAKTPAPLPDRPPARDEEKGIDKF